MALDLLNLPDATVEAAYRAEDYTAGSWPDRTANGHDMSQATGGAQPSAVADGGADFNNQPVVRGDGSDDFLSNNTLSLSQPYTIIVIGKVTSDLGRLQVFVGDDGGFAPYMGVTSGEVPQLGASPQLNGSTDILDMPVLLEGAFNGGSSSIRRNSVVEAAGSADTSALAGLRVFARGSGNFMGADIAEVVIIDGVLTDDDRLYLAQYAEERYGFPFPFPPEGTSVVLLPLFSVSAAGVEEISSAGSLDLSSASIAASGSSKTAGVATLLLGAAALAASGLHVPDVVGGVAVDTGFVIAGAGANNNSAGTLAWGSPGNIVADDGARASAIGAGAQTSNFLVSSQHGFSIPSANTIVGIELQVQMSPALGITTVQFSRVSLVKAGVIQSTDRSAGETLSGLDTNYPFGGASDLWDGNYTPDDINHSGFGVAVQINGNDPDSTAAECDAVWIKVYSIAPNALVFSAVTLAASGTHTPPSASGTAALALANATLAASGEESMTATAALPLSNAVLAASGLHAPDATATAALALASAAISSAAVSRYTSTAALPLSAVVLAATGMNAPPASGTAALDLPSATLAASAEEIAEANAALSLSSMALAGVGIEAFTSDGALALASAVLAATATHTGPSGAVGDAALSLATVALAVAAEESVPSSAALALSRAVIQALSEEEFTSSAALSLAAFTLAVTGEQSIPGAAALALSAITLAAAGEEELASSAAMELHAAVVNAAGISQQNATSTAALQLTAVVLGAVGTGPALPGGVSPAIISGLVRSLVSNLHQPVTHEE